MNELLKKLNYKDQAEIYIIHAPEEFSGYLSEFSNTVNVVQSLKGVKKLSFILFFVKTEKEIREAVPYLQKFVSGDEVVWFAFPKGTSKKYKAEISRDKGWESLRENGFDTVRAVAIDEDWSALRFRRVEFIKAMSRG